LGITQQICEIITGIDYQDLGEDCVARVKRAIKDGLAVAVAGADQQPVRIAAAHVADYGARPQSTVWTHGFRTSPVYAALVNGMATHVLDFEPMWSPPTHSVSPTVPVAFALAEAKGCTGRQIVTAVAKGLEIQGRMQYAGDQYVPEELLFHPPGVSGVMGAAVTAGHMLKLDADRLRHAMGIAGSRAGALLANIGSMTKSAHCGNAGASGLDAALLARRGFTANMDILEAHKGVIETFYRKRFDDDRFLAFGKPYRVVDPGHAIKLYPSQYATQFSITAGLEIHEQVRDPRRISRVKINGPVMKYVDRPAPVSGLDGKFSLQYTAAAAILDGTVKIDTFSDQRRFRKDMVDMLGKTSLTQDPSIPNDLHDMRVEITVETVDGARHHAVCKGPKGTWGAPPLQPADHLAKLQDCFSRVLARRDMDKVLDNLGQLEKLNADGVRGIVRLIAGRKKKAASMKMLSRVAVVALALVMMPAPDAAAQAYPSRPIRFIVPQAVGGSTDTLSRMVGQKLADALGQQVVVDNRAGANGIIGTELVARAPADGYTLLAGGTGTIAINVSLYKKIPYDPLKDFAPVANIAYSTSVLVVHPSVAAKNIAELIALARSKPGELRYASAGSGSSPHLSAEMFKTMAGVNILHVPYKGSTPGVTATVSGEVSLMFTGVASALGHIRAGRLRALSVNGPKRSPALPDVPIAADSGLPGFEVDFWIGILAPAGTPGPVVSRLNKEVNRIIVQDDVRERLVALGTDAVGGSPQQFAQLIVKDIARWAAAIKASGVKPE
jgi:tripartite-type tricarboxylate transporter receptor subunit TctC/2-methylcitrate dehydratase PrpD